MGKTLSVIIALIFWGVFSYTIFQVPYPESLTSANLLQLTAFFIPLFLAITFTINIFLKFFTLSGILAISLIIILLLQALHILNLVTAGLVIITTILLSREFNKKNFSTKLPKITKALQLNSKSQDSTPRLSNKSNRGTLSKLKKVNL